MAGLLPGLRELHLGLFLGIVFSLGCGQQEVPQAPDAVYEAAPAAAPVAAAPSAPQPANQAITPDQQRYIDLLHKHASITREIGDLYKKSLAGGNLAELLEQINAQIGPFEETSKSLLDLPIPDEAFAKSLSNGAIKVLDNAVYECKRVHENYHLHQKTGASISPELLNNTQSLGRKIRAHLLDTILSPEDRLPAVSEMLPEDKKPKLDLHTLYQQPGADSKIPWSVNVDPAIHPFELEDEERFSIRIPGGGKNIPKRNYSGQEHYADMLKAAALGVHYPRTPSLIVRVGNNINTKNVSEIWDLGSKRKLGRIDEIQLGEIDHSGVSADGGYFAAQPYGQQLIGVWDVKQAKVLGKITVETFSGVQYIAFGFENRLLFLDNGNMKILTIPELERTHTIPLNSWTVEQQLIALSPGGRYLAVADRPTEVFDIKFYDITTGELVGTIETQRMWPHALAFSPDGQYLAAMESEHKNAIHLYQIKDGKKLGAIDLELTKDQQAVNYTEVYEGPELAFFTDNQRVLISGYFVVDIRNGKTVNTLPTKVAYETRIIGPRRMSVLHQTKLVPWEFPDDFK